MWAGQYTQTTTATVNRVIDVLRDSAGDAVGQASATIDLAGGRHQAQPGCTTIASLPYPRPRRSKPPESRRGAPVKWSGVIIASPASQIGKVTALEPVRSTRPGHVPVAQA